MAVSKTSKDVCPGLAFNLPPSDGHVSQVLGQDMHEPLPRGTLERALLVCMVEEKASDHKGTFPGI